MSQFLTLAKSLLSRPTVPWREHWLLARLDRHLSEVPGAELQTDRFGNRFARIRRGSPTGPPVALVAHVDHPGFTVDRVEGTRVHGHFHGGVNDEYFPGAAVRLYRTEDDAGIAGKVIHIGPREPNALPPRAVELEAESPADGAVLAMWDLPAFQVMDGILSSRSVDDVIGCAMILETLRRVASSDAPADLICVFTRAEEVGFRGALCLAESADRHACLPADAWVLSIETSSARPQTPVGDGAVVRVGDKSTIFDPLVTATLVATAKKNTAKHGRRPLKRALMDGGTCEATVFCAAGWRGGALCVPLGNYHNMNTDTRRIAAEYVNIADCEDLIATMESLARGMESGESADDQLRAHLRAYREDAEPKLIASARG